MSEGNQTSTGAVAATEELKAEIKAVVDAIGEKNAAEALGVSRHSVLRAVAGYAVRRGTLAAIREGLAALRAAEKPKAAAKNGVATTAA